MNLNIYLSYEPSPEQREGVESLFGYLAPILERYPAPYLEGVHVVPRGEISMFANDLIVAAGGPENAYESSPFYDSTGIAIPIEGDREMRCYVVLAAELFEGLTPGAFLPAETVSTVLEEFLHCHLYCTAWDRRGYISPRVDPERTCEDQFLAIVTRAADEYFVNRRKATILDENPLVNCEGGATTCRVEFGSDLAESLEAGELAIRQAVSDVVRRRVGFQVGADRLLAILYRGLVEPLCRSAGPMDAYENSTPELWDSTDVLPISPAARELWSKMRPELRHAYQNPSETESALDLMARELIRYAASVGVKLRSDGASGCHMDFFSRT